VLYNNEEGDVKDLIMYLSNKSGAFKPVDLAVDDWKRVHLSLSSLSLLFSSLSHPVCKGEGIKGIHIDSLSCSTRRTDIIHRTQRALSHTNENDADEDLSHFQRMKEIFSLSLFSLHSLLLPDPIIISATTEISHCPSLDDCCSIILSSTFASPTHPVS